MRETRDNMAPILQRLRALHRMGQVRLPLQNNCALAHMRLRPCAGHPIRQLADTCTDLRAVVLVGLLWWAALVGVAAQTQSPTVDQFNGEFDYSSAASWMSSSGKPAFEICQPTTPVSIANCWAKFVTEKSDQSDVTCAANANCLIDMNDKEGSKDWIITVEATAELVVRCAVKQGCEKLAVTCSGTCTVDCSGTATCKELVMTCGTDTKTCTCETTGTLKTCRC